MVCLNYNQLSDVSNGKKYLDELKSQFPDDDFTLNAKLIAGDVDNNPAPKLNKEIAAKKEVTEVPNKYSLLGNYPNPFNPTTTISYALPYSSLVQVTIFDIMGREIRNFELSAQNAGIQNLIWDGRNSNAENVSSGIYLYHFKAVPLERDKEIFEKTAKLLLVK